MPDLSFEERFRIFQLAPVTYAFQIQINCALYSISKLASERRLADLTCADQRDDGRASQSAFKSSLDGRTGYYYSRKS